MLSSLTNICRRMSYILKSSLLNLSNLSSRVKGVETLRAYGFGMRYLKKKKKKDTYRDLFF